MVVTAGVQAASLANSFSFDSPSVLGHEWDVRRGWSGYASSGLPENGCAGSYFQGVEFAKASVYGCDGSWGQSSAGVESGGATLCGAGYRVCSGTEEVARLGVNATLCATKPRPGVYL